MKSPVLKKAEVQFLNLGECKTLLHHSSMVTDKQTCTVPETGNACMGDSGGPLTALDTYNDEVVQLGIISFGKASSGRGCSSQDTDIVVYTKVYAYRDWIIEHVRADD